MEHDAHHLPCGSPCGHPQVHTRQSLPHAANPHFPLPNHYCLLVAGNAYKNPQQSSRHLHSPLFIAIAHSLIPLYLLLSLTLSFHSHFSLHLYSHPMKTRTRNKSKHPAAPIMTPSQLFAAGISTPHSKNPKKKLTKDQRILALEEDLRLTRELLRTVTMFISLGPNLLTDFVQNNSPIAGGDVGMMPQSPDHDGDTEPATDDDSSYIQTSSQKRKSRRPASGRVRYVGDIFGISSLTTLM